jgi:hypothetical protein
VVGPRDGPIRQPVVDLRHRYTGPFRSAAWATESGDDGADPSIAIVAKPNAPAIGPLGNGTCPKVDGEGEFDGLVFCSSMSFARKRRPAYVSETIVESDVAQRSRTTVEPQPVFRQDRPRTANVVDGTTRRNRR